MSVGEALRQAARRLSTISSTPRLDSELLMAHTLGIGREPMLLHGLDGPEPAGFEALVVRRLACEPVAYITGRRSFWTIELAVEPGVLIPRPDSETLIEAAVEHFGEAGPRRILDLGTGSGALLLAALDQWPRSTGHGRDSSARAIAVASGNARRLGLDGRATFSPGDWGDNIDGDFDLVLCNPPYVEEDADLPPDVAGWEPAEALFAGADGLDCYRRIAPSIGRLLAPGGIACVEIGAFQAGPGGALFAASGLRFSVLDDLAGRPRCLVLQH